MGRAVGIEAGEDRAMDIAGGEKFDVIVVGAGNAATCAALSAREGGARVLMLEVAPEHWRGGNSAFTGGAWRIVYHGFADLARLIPDISEHELNNVDVGTYTEERYYDDVGRLTEYRSDPDLTEILITRSFEAGLWMREQGVRFQLGLGRQAFQVNGKFKFWGGLACHIWGGGKELMKALHGRAEREQITILYNTPAVALLQGDDGIAGVRARHQGRLVDLRAKAVVLASGGFEANAEMRARYLGPGWDLAKVRGSRFNTGQGLKMALDIGAAPAGHWSGILMSVTAFKSTAIRSASSSMRRASAFSTRASISTATPTPSTAAKSSSSRACSPGRCSTRRPSTCCATNTAFREPPRRRPTVSRRWPTASKGSMLAS